MKKALMIVAAVALVVWVASWFRAGDVVAKSAARPWPAGMGTLDSVADRLPPLEANAASLKLTALANALPKTEAIENYVSSEIARGELTIGSPPPLSDISAIRELLLREPIVWARNAGVADIGDQATSARRTVQMTAARWLVASALVRARVHDAAAWQDLQAVWNLARSLETQPQMMEQTAALAMLRMINAVAWKMPLPVPAWFADLQSRDAIRPLLGAFQYQAASYCESGAQIFPTKWLADSVEHDRAIAEEVVRITRCDVNVPTNDLGTDLSSVWRRAFRYRAEREATANALRVREGKPIETGSRCSDGAWKLDGATLRFSHDIASKARDRSMPLVLRLAE
jgi:hypothetical protein